MTHLSIEPMKMDNPKFSSRSWFVCDKDEDKVLALFGIEANLGGCVVFSEEIAEYMPKKLKYRIGKETMAFIKTLGYKSLCAMTHKEYVKFLTRLGWKSISRQGEREIMVWEQQHYL